MGDLIGVGFSVGGRICEKQPKRFETVSQQHNTANTRSNEENHLYISCGENASSPMMFSFKPVGIYLPVDVNNVAFLQRELPEDSENDNEAGSRKIQPVETEEN